MKANKLRTRILTAALALSMALSWPLPASHYATAAVDSIGAEELNKLDGEDYLNALSLMAVEEGIEAPEDNYRLRLLSYDTLTAPGTYEYEGELTSGIEVAEGVGMKNNPVRIVLKNASYTEGSELSLSPVPFIEAGKDSYVEVVIEGENNFATRGEFIHLNSAKELKISGSGTLNAEVIAGAWPVIGPHTSIQNGAYNISGTALSTDIIIEGEDSLVLKLSSSNTLIKKSGSNIAAVTHQRGAVALGTNVSSSGSISVKSGTLSVSVKSTQANHYSGTFLAYKGTSDESYSSRVFIDGGSVNSEMNMTNNGINYGGSAFDSRGEALSMAVLDFGAEAAGALVKYEDAYGIEKAGTADAEGKLYPWFPEGKTSVKAYALSAAWSGTVSGGAAAMTKDEAHTEDNCGTAGEFEGTREHLSAVLTPATGAAIDFAALNKGTLSEPYEIQVPAAAGSSIEYGLLPGFIARSSCEFGYHALKSYSMKLYAADSPEDTEEAESAYAELEESAAGDKITFKNAGKNHVVRLALSAVVSDGIKTFELTRDIYFIMIVGSRVDIDLAEVESNENPYVLIADGKYYIGTTEADWDTTDEESSFRFTNSSSSALRNVRIFITHDAKLELEDIDITVPERASLSQALEFEKTHALLSVSNESKVELKITGENTLSQTPGYDSYTSLSGRTEYGAPAIEIRSGSELTMSGTGSLDISAMIYGTGIGASPKEGSAPGTLIWNGTGFSENAGGASDNELGMGLFRLESGALSIDASRLAGGASAAGAYRISWAIGNVKAVSGSNAAAAAEGLVTEAPDSADFIMEGGSLSVLQQGAQTASAEPYAINVPAYIANASVVTANTSHVFRYAAMNAAAWNSGKQQLALVPVAVGDSEGNIISGEREIEYKLTIGGGSEDSTPRIGRTDANGVFYIYLPVGINTRIHSTITSGTVSKEYNKRITPKQESAWEEYSLTNQPWAQSAEEHENFALLLESKEGRLESLSLRKGTGSEAAVINTKYKVEDDTGELVHSRLRIAPQADVTGVVPYLEGEGERYDISLYNVKDPYNPVQIGATIDQTKLSAMQNGTDDSVLNLNSAGNPLEDLMLVIFYRDANRAGEPVTRTYNIQFMQLSLDEEDKDSGKTLIDVGMGDVVLRNPSEVNLGGVSTGRSISSYMLGNGGTIEPNPAGYIISGYTEDYRVYIGSAAGDVTIKNLIIDHSSTNPAAGGYSAYARIPNTPVVGKVGGLASAYQSGCLILDWTDYENGNQGGSTAISPTNADGTQQVTKLRIEGFNFLIGPSAATNGAAPEAVSDSYYGLDLDPTNNSYLDGALVVSRDTVAYLTGDGTLEAVSSAYPLSANTLVASSDSVSNTWASISFADGSVEGDGKPHVFFGKEFSDLLDKSSVSGFEIGGSGNLKFLSKPLHYADPTAAGAPVEVGPVVLNVAHGIAFPESTVKLDSDDLEDNRYGVLWLPLGYQRLALDDTKATPETYYAKVYAKEAPTYAHVNIAEPSRAESPVVAVEAADVTTYKGGDTTLYLRGNNLGGTITVQLMDGDTPYGEPVELSEEEFKDGDTYETWTAELTLPKNENTVPKTYGLVVTMLPSAGASTDTLSAGETVSVSQKLAITAFELPDITIDGSAKSVQLGEAEITLSEGSETVSVELPYDIADDAFKSAVPKTLTINTTVGGDERISPNATQSIDLTLDTDRENSTAQYILYSNYEDQARGRNGVVFKVVATREEAPTLTGLTGGATADWHGGSASVTVSGFGEHWSSFENAASSLGRKVVVKVYASDDSACAGEPIATGELEITKPSAGWGSVSSHSITVPGLPSNPELSYAKTEYPVRVFINDVLQATPEDVVITVPARSNEEKNKNNRIAEFTIPGLTHDSVSGAAISGVDIEITYSGEDTSATPTGSITVSGVEFGTDLTSYTPTVVLQGERAEWTTDAPDENGEPGAKENINFGGPVHIFVTSEYGITRDYTVRVNTAADTNARLKSFSIPGQDGEAVISHGSSEYGAGTIDIKVPYSAPISFLQPSKVLAATESATARVAPVSTSSYLDFNKTQRFRVTAESGATKTYTVRVEREQVPSVTGIDFVYPTNGVFPTSYGSFEDPSNREPAVISLKNHAVNFDSFKSPGLTTSQSSVMVALYRVQEDGSLVEFQNRSKSMTNASSDSDYNFNFVIPALADGAYEDAVYMVQVFINGTKQLDESAANDANRRIVVPGVKTSDASISGFHIDQDVTVGGKTVHLEPDSVKGIDIKRSATSSTVTEIHVYLPKITPPEVLTNLVISRDSFEFPESMRGDFIEVTDYNGVNCGGVADPFTYLDEGPAPEFDRVYHTKRFAVRSEDGTNTQFYDVSFEILLSDEGTMESFAIDKEVAGDHVFNKSAAGGGTISVNMPYETNLASLVPKIVFKGYRSVLRTQNQENLNIETDPFRKSVSLNAQDFSATAASASSRMEYTVTAEDKSVETFRVTVTKDPVPKATSAEIIYPEGWDWKGGEITIRLKDYENFSSFYRNTLSTESKTLTMTVTGQGATSGAEDDSAYLVRHPNASTNANYLAAKSYSSTKTLVATSVPQGGYYDFKFTLPSNVQYDYADYTYTVALSIGVDGTGSLGRMNQTLKLYSRDFYDEASRTVEKTVYTTSGELEEIADNRIFVPREVSDNIEVLDVDLRHLGELGDSTGSTGKNEAGRGWYSARDYEAEMIKVSKVDDNTTLIRLVMPIATKQREIMSVVPGIDALTYRHTTNTYGEDITLFRGKLELIRADAGGEIETSTLGVGEVGGEFDKPYIDILKSPVNFTRGRTATYRLTAEDGVTTHDYQVVLLIRKDHAADMGKATLVGREYDWSWNTDGVSRSAEKHRFEAVVDNENENFTIDQLPFYYIPVPDSFTGTVYDKEGEPLEDTEVQIHWLGEHPQEKLLSDLDIELQLASVDQLATGIKRLESLGNDESLLDDDKAETGWDYENNRVMVTYFDTNYTDDEDVEHKSLNLHDQFVEGGSNPNKWLTQEYTVMPENSGGDDTGGGGGNSDIDYELQIHSVEVLQKSTEIINPKFEEQKRDPQIGIWPEELENSEDIKPMVTAGDDIMAPAPDEIQAFRWIKFYVSSGTDLENVVFDLPVPEGSGERIMFVEEEEIETGELDEEGNPITTTVRTLHTNYQDKRNFTESRDKPLEYIVFAEDHRVHERWKVSFIKLSSGEPPKPGNQTTTETEVTGGSTGFIGGGAAAVEEGEAGTSTGLTDGVEMSYVSGIENEDGSYSFQPTRPMTRAEAAALLMQLMNAEGMGPSAEEDYTAIAAGYSDVDPDEWYAKAVGFMSKLGIFEGNKYGEFQPLASITRQQFAVILCRMLDEGIITTKAEVKNEDPYFSDIWERWGEAEIIRLARLGIINGYPDGTFLPDNIVTRAEAVAMINRLTGRSAEKEIVEKLMEEGIIFSDMAETNWAYTDVLIAANSWEIHTTTTISTWTGRRVGGGDKEVTEETGRSVEVEIVVLTKREQEEAE